MPLKEMLNICIPFALSHAWEIGRRVLRATRKNEDPVHAVLKEERKGSVTIISGKVMNHTERSHACTNQMMSSSRISSPNKL